jgi:hypothetical protein
VASEADSAATPTWWVELPPVEKARFWEKVAPGSAVKILAQTDRQVKHLRILAWAKFTLSAFSVVSALATVVLFVWLAKYYVDHGAATQGAAIIGALAAVVTAFIGGRALVETRNGADEGISPEKNAVPRSLKHS